MAAPQRDDDWYTQVTSAIMALKRIDPSLGAVLNTWEALPDVEPEGYNPSFAIAFFHLRSGLRKLKKLQRQLLDFIEKPPADAEIALLQIACSIGADPVLLGASKTGSDVINHGVYKAIASRVWVLAHIIKRLNERPTESKRAEPDDRSRSPVRRRPQGATGPVRCVHICEMDVPGAKVIECKFKVNMYLEAWSARTNRVVENSRLWSFTVDFQTADKTLQNELRRAAATMMDCPACVLVAKDVKNQWSDTYESLDGATARFYAKGGVLPHTGDPWWSTMRQPQLSLFTVGGYNQDFTVQMQYLK